MDHLASKFIVFDGPEGSGKSTQTELLRKRLEDGGTRVLTVRDPGSTRIGEQVRRVLLNPEHGEMGMRCEMLLYMAARAQMMHQLILPALADGQFVLCDRFVSSTLAYQLGGDGLTDPEIRAVGDIAIKHRWPDLTFIFDLPTSVSSRRVRPKFTLFPDDPDAGVEKDRIEQRSHDYHEQVRQNYLKQAADHADRYRVIDATRSPEAVHEDIWGKLRALA